MKKERKLYTHIPSHNILHINTFINKRCIYYSVKHFLKCSNLSNLTKIVILSSNIYMFYTLNGFNNMLTPLLYYDLSIDYCILYILSSKSSYDLCSKCLIPN